MTEEAEPIAVKVSLKLKQIQSAIKHRGEAPDSIVLPYPMVNGERSVCEVMFLADLPHGKIRKVAIFQAQPIRGSSPENLLPLTYFAYYDIGTLKRPNWKLWHRGMRLNLPSEHPDVQINQARPVMAQLFSHLACKTYEEYRREVDAEEAENDSYI